MFGAKPILGRAEDTARWVHIHALVELALPPALPVSPCLRGEHGVKKVRREWKGAALA